MSESSSSWSAANFAELVQTVFEVSASAGGAVRLKLIDVTLFSPPVRDTNSGKQGAFESFSLLFDGPMHPGLEQGTYRFVHENLGSFDLFIVPVAANASGRQYEAVFNRRIG